MKKFYRGLRDLLKRENTVHSFFYKMTDNRLENTKFSHCIWNQQFTETSILHTCQEHFCNVSRIALHTINMLRTPNFKSLAQRSPLNPIHVCPLTFSTLPLWYPTDTSDLTYPTRGCCPSPWLAVTDLRLVKWQPHLSRRPGQKSWWRV